MPAKKSAIISTAVPAVVPTVISTVVPTVASMSVPVKPLQEFAMAPQFLENVIGNIPVAQSVSMESESVTNVGGNPVELLEAQLKMMKEYVVSMEKTLKEAKKGMKKSKVSKDPNAPKNPVPSGTQAWNAFVALVQDEESERIRTTDSTKGADWKGITRKEAMAKAKELKAAGDPRYTYVKKSSAKSSPELKGSTSADVTAVEVKKRGRKPKAMTLPVPALPPTMAGSEFASLNPPFQNFSEALDDPVEVEEISINGNIYLMSAKKECWHMHPNGEQGAWAGIYNGSIIISAPEP
jgi:hypothetical protein